MEDYLYLFIKGIKNGIEIYSNETENMDVDEMNDYNLKMVYTAPSVYTVGLYPNITGKSILTIERDKNIKFCGDKNNLKLEYPDCKINIDIYGRGYYIDKTSNNIIVLSVESIYISSEDIRNTISNNFRIESGTSPRSQIAIYTTSLKIFHSPDSKFDIEIFSEIQKLHLLFNPKIFKKEYLLKDDHSTINEYVTNINDSFNGLTENLYVIGGSGKNLVDGNLRTYNFTDHKSLLISNQQYYNHYENS